MKTPLRTKLDAVEHCVKEEAFEDALGHLRDLQDAITLWWMPKSGLTDVGKKKLKFLEHNDS